MKKIIGFIRKLLRPKKKPSIWDRDDLWEADKELIRKSWRDKGKKPPL